MVFSTARRVTRSHHDAEDVAQGCFLELARKASSIRISIPAFLHATATRRSIDLLRDKGRRRKLETQAATERSDLDDSFHPGERSWDEISPEVDRAIDRLSDELKTVVILYFLRGLAVGDIAVETGINRGKIERRLQVGIRTLRADLSRGNRTVATGLLAAGLRSNASAAVSAKVTAATGRIALAAALRAAPGHQTAARALGKFWIVRPMSVLAITAACIALAILFLVRTKFTGPAGATSDSGSLRTYDHLDRLYAGSLPVDDTAGFGQHIASIRHDPSSFWRGTQPLFFQWCRSNCRDWLADSRAIALCQASPNLEDAEHLPAVVNPSDTARLPVQIELLQGMVIARLATDRPKGRASEPTTGQIAAELCRAYRASLLSDAPVTPSARDFDDDRAPSGYLDGSGNFRSVILGRQEKVVEILRPSPVDPSRIEASLTEAFARSPALYSACGVNRPIVRAVRASVCHDSVVEQGRLRLVVQLEGSSVLLQLQQQTASSAELSGAIAADVRSPGRRAAEDAAMLAGTDSLAIGWLDDFGRSFTVAPVDVRSRVYELRKDRWIDPMEAARDWAIHTAETHRRDPHRAELAAVVTADLERALANRSDAYLKAMEADLNDFAADPRVTRDRGILDARLVDWLNQAGAAAGPEKEENTTPSPSRGGP